MNTDVTRILERLIQGELKQVDGTAAKLVQLRYFAGLTFAKAAEIRDISSRSADRVWAYAKAWLRREMT